VSCTREQLWAYAKDKINIGSAPDAFEHDCDIIEYLLDHCTVTVPPQNRFFVSVNCAEIAFHVRDARGKRFEHLIQEHGLCDGEEALAHTGLHDFGHTTTHWDSVVTLGIAGLCARAERVAANPANTAKQQRFYDGVVRVYRAALRFVRRCAEAATAADKPEMAQGLERLVTSAPRNLFETMQTILIYYVLQQMVEGTVLRALGRLDQLLYPHYKQEDRSTADALLLDFLHEIDRLHAVANIPFHIGGTDVSGNHTVNELSYALLDAYRASGNHDTKLHLLVAKNTPDDIIAKAFEAVREGNNSIMFMSDETIIQSLENLGEDHTDAVDYHIVGCYECGGNGELTCSCNARVNLPKALELALHRGRDMFTDKPIGLANNGEFATFDDLFAEFLRQTDHLCNQAMLATDLYEANSAQIHTAPISSGAWPCAMETGGDLYADFAAKYNNSSLNAVGLATAVDSLVAIRKFVFEDKILTLSQLTEILQTDWAGHEALRLQAKHKCPQYGTADKAVDVLAKATVDRLATSVQRRPNAKGGVWRLGLFSIDWRWAFGEKTAASADGRHAGEPVSQNTGASFGADKQGATAHLMSVAAVDATNTPNGAIADIDLHISATQGDSGIRALVAMLRTYFALGGFGVHFNVLDTETLKKAKADPTAYPNLQVRVCGWNALFASLTEKEQDEFIARSVR